MCVCMCVCFVWSNSKTRDWKKKPRANHEVLVYTERKKLKLRILFSFFSQLFRVSSFSDLIENSFMVLG